MWRAQFAAASTSMSVSASVGTRMRSVGVATMSWSREGLLAELPQQRAAARQRLQVVGAGDGVAAEQPAREMDGVVARMFAHPVGVDGGALDAADHGDIGADRAQRRAGDVVHRRAARLQHVERRLEAGHDGVVGAVEEPCRAARRCAGRGCRRSAPPRSPARLRARLVGSMRVAARRSPLMTRAASRAVRVSGPTLSMLKDSGMTPVRGTRVCVPLMPVTPQIDGRQADRTAGVRPQRRREEARRDAGTGAR